MDQLNAIQGDLNVVSNLEIQPEVAFEIICYNGGLPRQFLFYLIRSPFSLHFPTFTNIRIISCCVTKVKNKNPEEALFSFKALPSACLALLESELLLFKKICRLELFISCTVCCCWGILWYTKRLGQNSQRKTRNLVITHPFCRYSLFFSFLGHLDLFSLVSHPRMFRIHAKIVFGFSKSN